MYVYCILSIHCNIDPVTAVYKLALDLNLESAGDMGTYIPNVCIFIIMVFLLLLS